ncbi:MAG: basic secretory family protein [Anaeroplasmataceae bacterium]|nr:basic secretory family protein [Anaeroplasmataceae bacterium]
MFAFKSPANSKNIWKLCFKTKDDMNRIFYENRPIDEEIRLHGITEYITQTIYIDKDLDGFPLVKALRHELTHVYLWETGQQSRVYNEEEVADFVSIASPAICKTTDEIILRLKEGLYKKGE